VIRGCLAAALLGCAFGCAQGGAASRVSLHEGRFRVAGPPPSSFSVRVEGAADPILGESRLEDGTLVFTPRFPLRPGLTYVAVCDGVEQAFSLPAPPRGPAAEVVRVLPSADRLPENLLRFYVFFSAPMSRGEVYSRVRLLGSDGRPVELPFLELPEELWDREGRRVTLLFDPGRIKQGLKPREDSGPALERGRLYTLVVDAAWPDASGQALRAGFRKSFVVVAPDETQPDPRTWKLAVPPAGSREPLTVTLPEPLDGPMLDRCLVVRDASKGPVLGRVEVDEGETRWRFFPDAAWKAGAHALSVDTILEDRAGNSVARPFEIDVFRKIDAVIPTRTVELPFEVLVK
jgi:hypothetical protein